MNRRYHDARSIHLGNLRTWKAALRGTQGNPRLIVLAHIGETEVKREAVEAGVHLSRVALANLRKENAA